MNPNIQIKDNLNLCLFLLLYNKIPHFLIKFIKYMYSTFQTHSNCNSTLNQTKLLFLRVVIFNLLIISHQPPLIIFIVISILSFHKDK